MTPREFQRYWQGRYPGSLPVGHQLRDVYKDRWLRIHSLPQSKRYAETEAEYEEALRRHNTLLSDLLGEGGEYVLVTTGYSETPEPAQSYPELTTLAGDGRHFLTIPTHEPGEEEMPYYWHFFMSDRTWKEHSADKLLVLVADNTVANILFVSTRKGSVYHPYDGGADIIAKSASLKEEMRIKYSTWLPDNIHGL